MESLSIGIQDCWLIKSSLAAGDGGSGELSKRRAPFLSNREIELHASTSIGDKTYLRRMKKNSSKNDFSLNFSE